MTVPSTAALGLLSEEQIARVTHEANRAYCLSIGDTTQPSWDDAPDWQKSSALVGVRGVMSKTITTPEQSHESWLRQKTADGWVYGAEKDADKKTHPCILAYAALPAEQRKKDALFFAVVRALV